jgi:molecular chaperone HtpG
MARLKQFKAESKRVLDLMINSIYTNQEIFLRELISNASDAMDKLYVQSLSEDGVKFNKDDLKIEVKVNKELRAIHVKDYGIGMTRDELDKNLGTIAHSDSSLFKEDLDEISDVDIIGQFGVGFYSGYMVAKEMRVMSKSENDESGHVFISNGLDGYKVEKVEKTERGTEVILFLKDNTDDQNFDEYLEEENIKHLVKKYSDYVRYPIVMTNEEGEEETLNSMIPLWKRNKNDVTQEEYNQFYMDRFADYQEPLHTIHLQVEGTQSYNALLYIPSHLPFNFYNETDKHGLSLYSRSVFIQEHNEHLIADYFSFVRGVVDSADLNLNISREVLQNDRQVASMARRINRKVKSELELMLKNDRDKYEKFYENFGLQLKYGMYNHFGANKDELKDLVLFTTTHEDKLESLADIVSRLDEGQEEIYYVSADSILKACQLPQVEKVLDKNVEVLVLMDDVDEFALRVLGEYEGKVFKALNQGELDLDEESKETLKKLTEENKDVLEILKEELKDKVSDVRLTSRLKSHPVCLVSDEGLSFEMEKVLAQSPDESQHIKATRILEINPDHALFEALSKVSEDKLREFSEVLVNQAYLIEGLEIEDPARFSNLISLLMIEASNSNQN